MKISGQKTVSILFFWIMNWGISLSGASIWGGEQDLFSTANKKFQPGDIVTIVITEESSAAATADTITEKKTSSEANLKAVQGGGKNFFNGIFPQAGMESENSQNGKGSTNRSGKLNAVITAKIDRILPNGNLFLTGSRRIRINKETQIIHITGVARPKDVTDNNNISSTLLSDAEIKYEGKGPVGATSRPGLIHKVMNWLF